MNKLAILTILLATFGARAMQPSQITLQHGDGTTEKISTSLLLQSGTLKQMIEDLGPQDSLPIPQPIQESFGLIRPYFDLSHSNNVKGIKHKLASQTEQEVAHIATAATYLDIPLIAQEAIAALAQRLLESARVEQCVQQGSYNLHLTPDLAKQVAQAMLKNSSLKNEMLSKIIQNQQVQVLKGHTGLVFGVTFNHDGTLLASGSADDSIRLWNPHTGAQVGAPLTGHTNLVRSIAFNHDGTLLASGSFNNIIPLWNPRTGAQVGAPLRHFNQVLSIAFNHDGTLLATGSADNTIRLWNPRTGAQVGAPLTGHTGWVLSIAFNHDGTLLASGSFDDTIRVWNPRTGTQVGAPLTGHTDRVDSIAFNHDGTLLASGSADETIRVWNPRTGTQVGAPLTGHTDQVRSIAFNHDGTLLASGSYDKTIRLWNPRTGTQVGAPLTGHTHWVNSVAFNHDGTLLASGSDDMTIRLHSLKEYIKDIKWFDQEIKPEQVALLGVAKNKGPQITSISLPEQFQRWAVQPPKQSLLQQLKTRWNSADPITRAAITTGAVALGSYGVGQLYQWHNKNK